MADEQRYYVRRESCLAYQITADDIAAAEPGSALASATAGDWMVTQPGLEPALWTNDRFAEYYEVDGDGAAVENELAMLNERVTALEIPPV